ncbi:MAG: hypothetical protein JWQ59_1299 [Cryobacterium sp.]|nr:hypothetical protein [Cryobacterium sp.]
MRRSGAQCLIENARAALTRPAVLGTEPDADLFVGAVALAVKSHPHLSLESLFSSGESNDWPKNRLEAVQPQHRRNRGAA